MRKLYAGVLVGLTMLTFMGGNIVEAADNRKDESQKVISELYGKHNPVAIKGEPEISASVEKFIYSDIAKQSHLDIKQQELLTIVALTANNTREDLKAHIGGALKAGATPREIRETINQCTPYIGMPRVKAALKDMQAVFKKNKIEVPLEDDSKVNDGNRYAEGLKVQKGIFGGEHVERQIASAPQDQKHINEDLAANCFGDYYTRSTLDVKQREIITFTALVSLGGCDPQARAHARANISVGNTRQDLLNAVTAVLPYNGYPRTLNGIAAINAVQPAK